MSGEEGGPRGLTGGPAAPASGTLILAAAPIGRPEDASGRLAAELAAAPVIAAEDTRRLRRLRRRVSIHWVTW